MQNEDIQDRIRSTARHEIHRVMNPHLEKENTSNNSDDKDDEE